MSLARTFTESEPTVVTLAGRDIGKLETQFKLATCYVHRVGGKLGYHSLPPLRINMPCRADHSYLFLGEMIMCQEKLSDCGASKSVSQ